MTYTKDTFHRLFQSEFDIRQWQLLLRDYFHADKVRTSPEPLLEDADDREGYYLGNTTTADNYNLSFFYYKMKDVSVLRRRVGLRNLVKPYLRLGIDAAMAVFTDGKYWRLSLVCDLAEDATNTKRYTYVFGDDKALYKTPIKRFDDLQGKADSFQAIKKAFSVEALSDDFFEEYRNQYADFIKFLTGKRYVKKGTKWVEQTVGEPDPQFFSSFGGNEKMVRDYVKKMMGRIVFLYFLQSKGWLAGNYHYMHDLFYNSDQQDDFLDKVLEPMFFGLLNTKPEERISAPMVNGVGVRYIPNHDQIPYLNGGLFQQDAIDEVDSRFPAQMFKSLFDFFDSYNFTIDENDPNDAEVGVDPEMLGKIFENLLEDNKDKGVFYTPKEIVKYMCQESLIAYLQTDESDEAQKQHIANFVKTYNVAELGGATSDLATKIDQRLKDVKICDPAIGSGAFPMGLLRELYACRKAIEVFDADNAADIKRHIIQNNIYGVDIEKGAVDIARLRFWLALIIDEIEPTPLPNLDFKIMQGNSLLESYKGVDLSQIQNKVKREKVVSIKGRRSKKGQTSNLNLSLVFDEKDAQKNIQNLIKKYFEITDHIERNDCRNEINSYIKDYIKACAEGNTEIVASVDSLEIPNDKFFLWHTYFADVFEQGGFDIVIGNPPYGVSIKADYRKSVVSTLGNVPDYEIYYYFMVLAEPLLKEEGIMSYIVPNTFLFNTFAKRFRELIVSKWNILEILDCTKFPIFESAVVRNAINLFQKNTNGSKTIGYRNTANVKTFTELLGRQRENMAVESILSMNQNWGLAFNLSIKDITIVNKIGKFKDTIDVHYDVSQGYIPYRKSDLVKEYGEVKGEQIVKERLWHSQNKIDDTYIQEIYGRDITKYDYKSTGEFVKYGKHLACYVDLKFFNSQRLLVREITNPNIIACLLSEFFVNDPQLISIIKKDEDFSLEYLWAILNSKLATYFHFHHSPKATKGAFPKILVQDIKGFPIPNVKDCVKQTISNDVSYLLASKKEDPQMDTSSLENQIDFLVYHLYDLTYDEVLVVDPNTPFTREEYESYKE